MVTMTADDITYLVFGQAIPSLDADTRLDVVDALRDGDTDVALAMLLRLIDTQEIMIDADLLAQARAVAPSYA